MSTDFHAMAAQRAMACAMNKPPIELVDAAPFHAEITRLRAELAAPAEILDTLSRLPSWEFNNAWRARCAAAAKRARASK